MNRGREPLLSLMQEIDGMDLRSQTIATREIIGLAARWVSYFQYLLSLLA